MLSSLVPLALAEISFRKVSRKTCSSSHHQTRRFMYSLCNLRYGRELIVTVCWSMDTDAESSSEGRCISRSINIPVREIIPANLDQESISTLLSRTLLRFTCPFETAQPRRVRLLQNRRQKQAPPSQVKGIFLSGPTRPTTSQLHLYLSLLESIKRNTSCYLMPARSWPSVPGVSNTMQYTTSVLLLQ